MTAYSLEWSPISIQDLEQILEYIIFHDKPQTTLRLSTKIFSRIQSLGRYPKRCRIVPELKEQGILEYRELILAPYRIFFRLAEKKVSIIGILDGRRDLEELILQRVLYPMS